MKLREITRVDYKDSHNNTKRTTETTTRTSTTTTGRGRKPGTSVKGRRTAKPTVAVQRRTATGRVAKTAAANLKRSPGRPPERGPGHPSSTAAKTSSRVAPKGSFRRAAKRGYQPPSPIVKIVKKMPAPAASAAQSDGDNAEHPTSLMFKFFKAHEDDVAHIAKKKQRKALGKMWRESSVNPKNARAKKEVESSDTASEDELNVAKTKVEDVDSNESGSQTDDTEDA